MFDNSKTGYLIPNKKDNSVSGSEFIRNNAKLAINVREQNILDEFLTGNIPDFLRNFLLLFLFDDDQIL